MKRIVWEGQARRDYREAITFLADRNVAAARALRQKLDNATVLISRHSIGRPGRIGTTFEKNRLSERRTRSPMK